MTRRSPWPATGPTTTRRARSVRELQDLIDFLGSTTASMFLGLGDLTSHGSIPLSLGAPCRSYLYADPALRGHLGGGEVIPPRRVL